MKSGVTFGAAMVLAAGTAGAQCGYDRLTHFDPGLQDHFGQAVAAGGNVLVIGCPADDYNGAVDGGTRFIYERINGVWTYVSAVTVAANSVLYGRSVATDGTLVAIGQGGGPMNGVFPAGAGEIAKKINGAWGFGISLPGPAAAAGDDFGFSTAAGNGRAVFGAPRRDFNAGDDMGAVYAYRLDAQNNAQLVTQIIHPSAGTQAGEHFGYSVAVAPAGVPNAGTLVVGSPDRDSGNTASTGGIYVFNQTAQGYQLQNLPSQWDEAFQFNGSAVATNGSWIVSGAPSYGNARGRVFLYQKLQNGNWEVSGFISGPGGDGENFGSSISMSGEWMVVGAPGHDTAYVFREAGGSWTLYREVAASSVAGTSSWGSVVATDGADFFGGDAAWRVGRVDGAGSVVVKSLALMTGADEPGAAEDIGLPASVVGCLEGAHPTANGLIGVCGGSENAADVYFLVHARRPGTIVVDTVGSDFDTVLSVHTAEPTWQDAHTLACDDDIDGPQILQSRVAFSAVAGATYWVRVAGYNGAVGGFHLSARYGCAADFNDDGFLDFFDYDDFVACFETGVCPAGRTADVTGDDFVDFFDYDAYVVAFEAGC